MSIAKVAVARKLAVLPHALLVTGEVYEPLRKRETPVDVPLEALGEEAAAVVGHQVRPTVPWRQFLCRSALGALEGWPPQRVADAPTVRIPWSGHASWRNPTTTLDQRSGCSVMTW